nr:hypothetical protein [Paracoccus sp. (in: a-proteobacteria)]
MDHANERAELAVCDLGVVGLLPKYGFSSTAGGAGPQRRPAARVSGVFQDGDKPSIVQPKNPDHGGLDQAAKTQGSGRAAGQCFGAGRLWGRNAIEMQLDAGRRARGVDLCIGPANLARAGRAADDRVNARRSIPQGIRQIGIPVVFGGCTAWKRRPS